MTNIWIEQTCKRTQDLSCKMLSTKICLKTFKTASLMPSVSLQQCSSSTQTDWEHLFQISLRFGCVRFSHQTHQSSQTA